LIDNGEKILKAYLMGENSNTTRQLPKQYKQALERFIDYLYVNKDIIGETILQNEKPLSLEQIEKQLTNIQERLNRVKGYDYDTTNRKGLLSTGQTNKQTRS